MWPVIPPTTTLLVIGAMLVVLLTSARVIQPAWWEARPLRVASFVAFAAMLGGVGLWSIGRGAHHLPSVHLGAGIAYVGILVLAPALLVLPVSAALDRALIAATRARAPTPAVLAAALSPDPPRAHVTRRHLIRAGAATLPAIAAATGARGLTASSQAPRMPVVRMAYEGLHPDLEGFRILHLSDLHLGACLGLADLASALEAALRVQRPDLVALTGDLADDPGLIPGALDLVQRVAARHGALASLGNHEYLHGIDVTRPHYEASPVPLLVSAGRTLNVGRARLFVGGADDPVHMGGDIAWMLTPSIEAAASQAPERPDFRLLLCHRPEGFGPAAANGFDLTLSGHTHGGQLGLFGRSLFEHLRPETSWWGTYQRARPDSAPARRSALASSPSRLYTTSGFGHWFPFRVGCPTEMPLIVLERAPRPSSVSHRLRV